MKIWKLIRNIVTFFYNSKKSDLRDFPENEYIQTFIESVSEEKLKETYAKAWEAKILRLRIIGNEQIIFWLFK